MACRRGVDFTKVLRAAFTCEDPKTTKRQLSHQCLYALMGSLREKAACETPLKSTPDEANFHRVYVIRVLDWSEVRFVAVSAFGSSLKLAQV